MAKIEKILDLTKVEEGGLSRATTDTASKYPSPYEHKGVKGWHTNRGITYKTFESLSKKLGFLDTRDNFINMPDSIWLKIVKNGYWDILNLDALNSQAIANLFFTWQFTAGYGWRNRIVRYLASKNKTWNKEKLKELPNFINDLVNKEGEVKVFDELIQQQKEFYESLNQPANLKGWLNRLDRLKKYGYTFLSSGAEQVKKKPKLSILIGLLLIFGLYTYTKKKYK